jgi:hypothetical protein
MNIDHTSILTAVENLPTAVVASICLIWLLLHLNEDHEVFSDVYLSHKNFINIILLICVIYLAIIYYMCIIL